MARTFFNKTNVPGLKSGEFRPKIEVKPFGQWDEAIRMVNKLDPAIKRSSIKAQLKVCNKIRVNVRAHIRNQDLGWRALNKKYLRSKVSANMDTRTLIGRGTYYHAIEVWHTPSRHLVSVGVKRGVYTTGPNGKKSSLQVSEIAAIHEFSSGKRIPKRPLWNPTIAEMGGAAGLQKMYINSLTWWLQQEGIKLQKVSKINQIPNGLK